MTAICTGDLIAKLKKEGYDFRYSNLLSYVREGQVTPKKKGRFYSWDVHSIRELKAHLLRLGRAPEKVGE